MPKGWTMKHEEKINYMRIAAGIVGSTARNANVLAARQFLSCPIVHNVSGVCFVKQANAQTK